MSFFWMRQRGVVQTLEDNEDLGRDISEIGRK